LEVHFTPELEKKLNDLAGLSGRPAEELVQGRRCRSRRRIGGTREMLDSRYDDLKSGRVMPIDGEAFFEELRRREDELLKPPNG
jgi:hypothetical protein